MTLWQLLTVAAAGVGLVVLLVMAVIPLIAEEPLGVLRRLIPPRPGSRRRPSAT